MSAWDPEGRHSLTQPTLTLPASELILQVFKGRWVKRMCLLMAMLKLIHPLISKVYQSHPKLRVRDLCFIYILGLLTPNSINLIIVAMRTKLSCANCLTVNQTEIFPSWFIHFYGTQRVKEVGVYRTGPCPFGLWSKRGPSASLGGWREHQVVLVALASYLPYTKLQCFFLRLCQQPFFVCLHHQGNKHPQLKFFFSNMQFSHIQNYFFKPAYCMATFCSTSVMHNDKNSYSFSQSGPILNFTAVFLWCSLWHETRVSLYTLAQGRGTWRCL